MFVLLVFLSVFVSTSKCSSHEPVAVTRRILVPITYKSLPPNPLAEDWFLCKRGNVITACRKGQRQQYRSRQERQPLFRRVSGSTASPLLQSKSNQKFCSAKKCLHGSCVGPRCVCQAGWRGRYCGRDINECVRRKRSTCSHRCKNTLGSYKCVCRRGFHLDADEFSCRMDHQGNSDSEQHKSRTKVSSSCNNQTNAIISPATLLHAYQQRKLVSGIRMPVNTRASLHPFARHGINRKPVLTSLLFDVHQKSMASSAAANRYFLALQNMHASNGKNTDQTPCSHMGCQHHCVLTSPNKARCVCRNGFKLARNKRNCVDINECRFKRKLCRNHTVCHNTRGGYQCKCRKGFARMSTHNLTTAGACRDVNECLTGENKCGPHSICFNRRGYYFCRCKRGFNGNGVTCSRKENEIGSGPINRLQGNIVNVTQTTRNSVADSSSGFAGNNSPPPVNRRYSKNRSSFLKRRRFQRKMGRRFYMSKAFRRSPSRNRLLHLAKRKRYLLRP